MERINALKLRNKVGQILDQQQETGEPILISKGKKIRAVLITPEDFDRHFLHAKAEEEKRRFLETVRLLRKKRKEKADSLDLLRNLRGYSV